MVIVTGVAVEVFVIVTLLFGLTSSFAQTNMTTNTTTIYSTAVNANPLVYHLSSTKSLEGFNSFNRRQLHEEHRS